MSNPATPGVQGVNLRYASQGEPNVLVWQVPASITTTSSEEQCFVLPVTGRGGGLLIAIPKGVVSEEALLDANLLEDDGIVGPSKEFEAELLEEPEEGAPFRTGVRCPFLVLDVSAEVLPLLREYDPVTDMHEVVRPFSEDRPQDLPEVRDVLEEVTLWISSITEGRLNFYSAREEPVPTASSKKPAPKRITNNQIASQLAALAAQVQLLASQQEVMQKAQNAKSSDHLAPSAGHVPDRGLGIYPTSKIPALSASLGAVPQTTAKQLTGLIGPPPKTKSLAEVPNVLSVDPPAELGSTPLQAPESSDMQNIVSAISQQSLAITHLVSHLTSGDAIADLQSGGSTGVSTSTKGVARRERMQADLASRSSSYFLQVQQQMFKRMFPARVVPSSVEEIRTTGASMTAYLERYGGYRAQREQGLTAWIVGHAMDAAASGDFDLTKEYIGILAACLEQSTMDGNWNVAYVLSMLEEPPIQVFSDRMQTLSGISRPFAPLVPPAWAATTLSFLKEVELLQTKKAEVRNKAQPIAKSAADPSSPSDAPSPKRRPKFPKKPAAPPDGGGK